MKQNPISSPDYLIRYGMIEQGTNSADRFAKASRTIPIILDICKDMIELCPNAWLLFFFLQIYIFQESVKFHNFILIFTLVKDIIRLLVEIIVFYKLELR